MHKEGKMFNRKTLPTRSGKLQTAQIDDYNQIEQLSYNVRVTENGIEEQGTHDELLAKHGIYYGLYNS